MRYLLFFPILIFIACGPGPGKPEQSTLIFHEDSTRPMIQPGLYVVTDTMMPGSVRRIVHHFQQDGYGDQTPTFLDSKKFLSFKHVDLTLVDKDNTGRYQLLVTFNKFGTQELARITDEKAMTRPSGAAPEMALVLNNTVVEVVRVMGQITNGTIAMNGSYSKADLEKIEEEILQAQESVQRNLK